MKDTQKQNPTTELIEAQQEQLSGQELEKKLQEQLKELGELEKALYQESNGVIGEGNSEIDHKYSEQIKEGMDISNKIQIISEMIGYFNGEREKGDVEKKEGNKDGNFKSLGDFGKSYYLSDRGRELLNQNENLFEDIVKKDTRYKNMLTGYIEKRGEKLEKGFFDYKNLNLTDDQIYIDLVDNSLSGIHQEMQKIESLLSHMLIDDEYIGEILLRGPDYLNKIENKVITLSEMSLFQKEGSFMMSLDQSRILDVNDEKIKLFNEKIQNNKKEGMKNFYDNFSSKERRALQAFPKIADLCDDYLSDKYKLPDVGAKIDGDKDFFGKLDKEVAISRYKGLIREVSLHRDKDTRDRIVEAVRFLDQAKTKEEFGEKMLNTIRDLDKEGKLISPKWHQSNHAVIMIFAYMITLIPNEKNIFNTIKDVGEKVSGYKEGYISENQEKIEKLEQNIKDEQREILESIKKNQEKLGSETQAEEIVKLQSDIEGGFKLLGGDQISLPKKPQETPEEKPQDKLSESQKKQQEQLEKLGLKVKISPEGKIVGENGDEKFSQKIQNGTIEVGGDGSLVFTNSLGYNFSFENSSTGSDSLIDVTQKFAYLNKIGLGYFGENFKTMLDSIKLYLPRQAGMLSIDEGKGDFLNFKELNEIIIPVFKNIGVIQEGQGLDYLTPDEMTNTNMFERISHIEGGEVLQKGKFNQEGFKKLLQNTHQV